MLSMSLNLASRYRADSGVKFTSEFWNGFAEEIDRALNDLLGKSASFEEAREQLIQATLFRLNEILLPAYERVFQYQQGGFLTAPIAEASEVEFIEGYTILAIHPDNKELFRPTPFVALTRASTSADVAIARADGYNPETGGLQLEIVAVIGAGGRFSDVIVSATAGSVQAQHQFLTDTRSARDKAADWAEKAVDVAVEAGKFSAKHWATKAEASSSAAAGSAGAATTKAGEASSAATAAVAARDKAQSWAMANEDIPVEPDAYSAKHYADKAKHFAEQAQTFDPGSYYEKGQTYTRAEVEAIVAAAIDALIVDAPGTLDTLAELAAALGDDPNFAATITTLIAAKADGVHSHPASQISDASPNGRSLIMAANFAAMRTLLSIGTAATRAMTISTSNPSGGANGDLWITV